MWFKQYAWPLAALVSPAARLGETRSRASRSIRVVALDRDVNGEGEGLKKAGLPLPNPMGQSGLGIDVLVRWGRDAPRPMLRAYSSSSRLTMAEAVRFGLRGAGAADP